MSKSVYNLKFYSLENTVLLLNSFGFVIPYPLYRGSLKLNAANKDRDSQKNIRIHRILK